MSFQPQSLIQVHYHDRLSGVNKVVRLYAAAFYRLTGGRTGENIVVCGTSKRSCADFRPAGIVSVPLCDYREFSSKKQFERVKASLVKSLSRALTGAHVKGPVCVVGHNLTIGKNCALSSAFAEVARQHAGSAEDIRFYSVIHDFAEEGRAACLESIRRAKKWVDIGLDLFPKDGTVRMITLNGNNAAILERAGFNAAVLYNPVVGPAEGTPRLRSGCGVEMRSGCGMAPRLRSGCGITLRSVSEVEPPVILYPSRCISRKNILEAILLCNFIYKSNLMVGASGTSASDKAAFDKTVALCKKYRLPVMFDYGRVLADKPTGGIFTNKAFDLANACITTSVAEGFGYGLYEPWLYGKAVFGRKFLGFEAIAGVKFSGMYDRLSIPISWISASKLRDKYWKSMNECFGSIGKNALLSNRKKFDKAFDEYFIVNETIDFGSLDASMQFTIVESLIKSPKKIEEWELECKDQLALIKKSVDTAINKSTTIMRFNHARISKQLSLNNFSNEFGKVLSANRRPVKNPNGNRDDILRQFCSFERFRLLLAK